jgi:hypothetical protein
MPPHRVVALADRAQLVGLLHRRDTRAHLLDAAPGRGDDVVEAREVPEKSASVAADPLWKPLFVMGWPQRVWSRG